MGNRAIVVFENEASDILSPAAYLHWNGGPESIYPFLDELDRRKIRADQDYELSRFVQIVGEFFDVDTISGLSLGVFNGPEAVTPEAMGPLVVTASDHGVYLVCRGRKPRRVRRFVHDGPWDQEPSLAVEKPLAWVAQERREAYKHAYSTDPEGTIAQTLAGITGDKKILAM